MTSRTLPKPVAAVLESAGAEHRLISDEDLQRLSAEMSLFLMQFERASNFQAMFCLPFGGCSVY